MISLTPGAVLPAFFGDPTCNFFLGLLQLVYLHCSIWPIWPPSANAAFAPHPRLQTYYPFSAHFEILPLHLHHRLMLLAAGCFSLPPASSSLPYSLRVLQRNAGGLLARSTKLHTLFRLIQLTLFVSRNLTLIYLPLSGFLDSLLCHLMPPTRDLVFYLLMSQTLAAVSSFLSGRAYPSLSFSPSLFLRLTLTLIMWGSTSL